MPELEQLKAELQRENYKIRYQSMLRSTVYTLIVVSAVSVLVAAVGCVADSAVRQCDACARIR